MDAALSGSPDTAYTDELPRLIADTLGPSGGDARAAIRHIARLYRSIAEPAALGWLLYRDAAATDAEVAADWQNLQQLRHDTFAELVRLIPADSLRAGMTTETAIDTAWAIASPGTYELLVRQANYSLDRYEEWVALTLSTALLDPGHWEE